jgi:hypothetical protein
VHTREHHNNITSIASSQITFNFGMAPFLWLAMIKDFIVVFAVNPDSEVLGTMRNFFFEENIH